MSMPRTIPQQRAHGERTRTEPRVLPTGRRRDSPRGGHLREIEVAAHPGHLAVRPCCSHDTFEGLDVPDATAGQGDRIRTCDLVRPRHALYQAELHPDGRPECNQFGSRTASPLRRPCILPACARTTLHRQRQPRSRVQRFHQAMVAACGRRSARILGPGLARTCAIAIFYASV